MILQDWTVARGDKPSVGQQGDVVVGGDGIVRLHPGTVEIAPVFRHTPEITDWLDGQETDVDLLCANALISIQERNI